MTIKKKSINFHPNTPEFESALKSYITSNLQGFNQLLFNNTLIGKKATQKVIIMCKRWRGEWVGYANCQYAVYYK